MVDAKIMRDSLEARVDVLEKQLSVARGFAENRGKENDTLRYILADSALNCIYCGLSKDDMAKCQYGFPGCGRADDLVVGMSNLGEG